VAELQVYIVQESRLWLKYLPSSAAFGVKHAYCNSEHSVVSSQTFNDDSNKPN